VDREASFERVFGTSIRTTPSTLYTQLPLPLAFETVQVESSSVSWFSSVDGAVRRIDVPKTPRELGLSVHELPVWQYRTASQQSFVMYSTRHGPKSVAYAPSFAVDRALHGKVL